MKKLYRFTLDCGRQGELDGLFIEDEKEVERAIGKRVYFGEVLGKHSEICGDLEEEDFEVVTDDQDFIKKFDELIGWFGWNPVKMVRDKEEWEEVDE
jgi:hypothetical protein